MSHIIYKKILNEATNKGGYLGIHWRSNLFFEKSKKMFYGNWIQKCLISSTLNTCTQTMLHTGMVQTNSHLQT